MTCALNAVAHLNVATKKIRRMMSNNKDIKDSQQEWEWYQWYTARLSQSVNKLLKKDSVQQEEQEAKQP
jgi:hypothetical protein